MSISSTETIIERVGVATKQSPIAVFLEKSEDGVVFDALFASTVETQERIKRNDLDLIGVYHKGMKPQKIKDELASAKSTSLAAA